MIKSDGAETTRPELAETWDGLTYCPATREAVEEFEEQGDTGCPACGRPSYDHLREVRREH